MPAVHRVLKIGRLAELEGKLPHDLLVDAVRSVLASYREGERSAPSAEQVAEDALQLIEALLARRLQLVINATGVIIHTNLGRAPLSLQALEAMGEVGCGYSNLEFDLQTGHRSHRTLHVEGLLTRLTGAEAAMVVNNNAAAVFLVLAELARGKEVVLSRGQSVEIGGGFRIPEIMAQSGAKLVEVGTTNRTYLHDYEKAIGPDTVALMRVHSSNFKMIGFTHSVTLKELVQLAHSRGLVVIDDLGSGALLPTERYGLEHEPMAQESIEDGADVVCFSGDKLLGGPQAGIILGKQQIIERLARNPLARALRVDKLTLVALEVTLHHYLRGVATEKLPVWRAIAEKVDDLQIRAQHLVEILSRNGVEAHVVPTESTVGGGSLPGEKLPSYGVALRPPGISADELHRRLRFAKPPVIGIVREDHVVLDLRTVFPEQDEQLVEAVVHCHGSGNRLEYNQKV